MNIKFCLVPVLAASLLLVAGGARPASAAPAEARHHVVIVSGEYEYSSMLTLRALADQLQSDPSLEVTFLQRTAGEDIPGLAALAHADLLVTFIRRMTLPPQQLGLFRDYLQAGHPLVALRTSCHAFQNWKEFDHEVLGGNYHDHYRPEYHTVLHLNPAQRDDPLLAGLPADFPTTGTLYKVAPLAADTRLLLSGTLSNLPEASEPVAWTRLYHGGRIFFAALGDADDFRTEPFMRLLSHAIGWALQDHELSARLALRPLDLLPAHRLSPEEFAQYTGGNFGSYTFLDVRPAAAFAAGHVKKAVNFDPQGSAFEAQIDALDRTHNYVLYGESESATAAIAAHLHGLGFNIVHYLGAPYVWTPPEAKKPRL